MAWTSLTVTEVKTRLAGVEVTALQTQALAAGQIDPVVEIIQQVVDEVRGYVAAGGYTLGAAGTLPSKLLGAALAMIRYRCITRLPATGLLDDDRKEENRDAIALLRLVADGRFGLEEPTVEDDEVTGGSGPSMDDTPTLNFSLDEQDGL